MNFKINYELNDKIYESLETIFEHIEKKLLQKKAMLILFQKKTCILVEHYYKYNLFSLKLKIKLMTQVIIHNYYFSNVPANVLYIIYIILILSLQILNQNQNQNLKKKLMKVLCLMSNFNNVLIIYQ